MTSFLLLVAVGYSGIHAAKGSSASYDALCLLQDTSVLQEFIKKDVLEEPNGADLQSSLGMPAARSAEISGNVSSVTATGQIEGGSNFALSSQSRFARAAVFNAAGSVLPDTVISKETEDSRALNKSVHVASLATPYAAVLDAAGDISPDSGFPESLEQDMMAELQSTQVHADAETTAHVAGADEVAHVSPDVVLATDDEAASVGVDDNSDIQEKDERNIVTKLEHNHTEAESTGFAPVVGPELPVTLSSLTAKGATTLGERFSKWQPLLPNVRLLPLMSTPLIFYHEAQSAAVFSVMVVGMGAVAVTTCSRPSEFLPGWTRNLRPHRVVS